MKFWSKNRATNCVKNKLKSKKLFFLTSPSKIGFQNYNSIIAKCYKNYEPNLNISMIFMRIKCLNELDSQKKPFEVS